MNYLRNKIDIGKVCLVVGKDVKSVFKKLAVSLEYTILLGDHNKVDRGGALCVVIILGIGKSVGHTVDLHKVLIGA